MALALGASMLRSAPLRRAESWSSLSSGWVLCAGLCLVACGSDDSSSNAGEEPNPSATPGAVTLTVTGRVYDSDSSGSPLEDVTVRAAVDSNGDGKISSSEEVQATTDEDGRFSIVAPGVEKLATVVSFRSSGYATVFRTLKPRADAEIELDVAMLQVEPLECTAGRCRSPNGALEVTGLPDGTSGSGRAFNPITERDSFPGDFGDDEGNLLLSGSFSFVELENEAGDVVHELDAPVALEMRVPRDTWPVIVDIDPSNERIDVPMYAFDEVSGEWTRDGEGYLIDADGAEIPVAELPNLRDGSFGGIVTARADVDHFSYWNVDWPIESHGCVTAELRTASGGLAAGATVRVAGRTYSGDSEESADEGGNFCLDVMRSENADEDIDNDGTKGTTHSVDVLVRHAGKLYALGQHEVPKAAGTCGGSCLDLGTVDLTEDKELEPVICEVEGIVVDIRGVPQASASVVATDYLVDQEAFDALCGIDNCDFFASSDATGHFTYRAPLIAKLEVSAFASLVEGPLTRQRIGKAVAATCPSGPITVTLDDGYDIVDLEVSLEGDSISWTSTEPVNHLFVYDAAGMPKWVIAKEGATLASPATYGELPAGFEQIIPTGGAAPGPLASGDVIYVQGDYNGEDGFLVLSNGQITVP